MSKERGYFKFQIDEQSYFKIVLNILHYLLMNTY